MNPNTHETTNGGAATPTPWTLHKVMDAAPDHTGCVNIRRSDENIFGVCTRYGTPDEANAALIVQAVNERAGLIAERDALRSALEKCHAWLTGNKNADTVMQTIEQARAALAKGAA